ncbi:hypothetical protein MRX96_031710, partial [Rhipicephalus microplus]
MNQASRIMWAPRMSSSQATRCGHVATTQRLLLSRYLLQNKLMAFHEFRDLKLREDDFTTANPSQVGDLAEAYASAGPPISVQSTIAAATHNVSMSAEILCYMSALTDISQGDTHYLGTSCPVVWDGLTCWPQTTASSLAVVPCFASLNGLDYDTTQNVTRQCWQNGSWAARSDYSNCRPILEGATADTQ